MPPPVILSFSLQTVQPGHHHQNLLGRKVGNTCPPAEQLAQVRLTSQTLTHLSCSRAETERGLSRKHIIEGRGGDEGACQVLLAPVPGCASLAHAMPGTCASHAGSMGLSTPNSPIHAAGLKASLERLQLEYVDVVFANRPDPNTPMEGGCALRCRAPPHCLSLLSWLVCARLVFQGHFPSRAESAPPSPRSATVTLLPPPARCQDPLGWGGLAVQWQVTAPVPAAVTPLSLNLSFITRGPI